LCSASCNTLNHSETVEQKKKNQPEFSEDAYKYAAEAKEL
jgi:hypothetical protein